MSQPQLQTETMDPLEFEALHDAARRLLNLATVTQNNPPTDWSAAIIATTILWERALIPEDRVTSDDLERKLFHFDAFIASTAASLFATLSMAAADDESPDPKGLHVTARATARALLKGAARILEEQDPEGVQLFSAG